MYNNAYQLRELNIAGMRCAEEGELAFFITRATGRMGMLRRAAKAFLQLLDGERDLEALCLEEAVVTSRRRLLNVAIDGEIKALTTPLTIRFRRGALRVIAPALAPIEAREEETSTGVVMLNADARSFV